MFKFKHRTSCILTVLAGIISIQVGNAITVPGLRPYINGEEVVGTTLESRYSTPDGESANPVIRWEKADVRNGKTVVVQQGAVDAKSYTLTDKDAGKYFRIIVGCGTKDEAASQWIGPVITGKNRRKASITASIPAELPGKCERTSKRNYLKNFETPCTLP